MAVSNIARHIGHIGAWPWQSIDSGRFAGQLRSFKAHSDSAAGISLHSITLIFHFRICRRPFIMRQISRLSVIAVSTALLITLSSCSSTQSTLEADDQPSTPIENREMTSDVQENKANGDSPQGSVTDAANFEITENEDGTVTISRYCDSPAN